ncbi:MAG: hypothetical protein JWP52_1622 [Rhizobacter sp.]|nr:hypothetical protein [Rhizobacter sp.]
MINVLLVEDSEVVRIQLRKLLGTLNGVSIVGEAPSEREAVVMIESLQPHAVLLDLTLAPGSGINVLRHVHTQALPCKVLVLSNETDPRYRKLCGQLGAHGFYDKSLEIKQVLTHLRGWSEGGSAPAL